MGVHKERKSSFLTTFELREKEARSLFAAQYWYCNCFWMSIKIHYRPYGNNKTSVKCLLSVHWSL